MFHTTFYLRRLHSLVGLLVLGMVLFEHIFTNSMALGGAPVLIGERINPSGKKRFQQALREHDLSYILSVGASHAVEISGAVAPEAVSDAKYFNHISVSFLRSLPEKLLWLCIVLPRHPVPSGSPIMIQTDGRYLFHEKNPAGCPAVAGSAIVFLQKNLSYQINLIRSPCEA